MNHNPIRLLALTALLLGTPLSMAQAQSQPLDGREIALRMHAADTSLDGRRAATMLIERGNQKLVRKLAMLNKKYGADEKTLTRFIEPADVRDTQYLSWSYDDTAKDDDMWVFFPSENLVRRISGGGKKGAFMRSDFANEDIEQRVVDDDSHTLLEETTLAGKAVYLIESTPIPAKARDTNYSKRHIWVDKDTWLAVQIEYFDRRGRLLKRLKQGGIQQIDNIWTATKLIMETPRKKSRTLMQYTDVEYNVDLADSVFQQSSLKR